MENLNKIVDYLITEGIPYEKYEFGISYEGFYSWYFIPIDKINNLSFEEIKKSIHNKQQH